MQYSTFLKIAMVASLCFLTFIIEAHYIDNKRQANCLPTNFTCNDPNVCCNNCISNKCT